MAQNVEDNNKDYKAKMSKCINFGMKDTFSEIEHTPKNP